MAGGEDPILTTFLWIVDDFSRIIRDTSPEELDAASAGTKWTNRQLLISGLSGVILTKRLR